MHGSVEGEVIMLLFLPAAAVFGGRGPVGAWPGNLLYWFRDFTMPVLYL